MDWLDVLADIGLALGGLAAAAHVLVKTLKPLTRLTVSTLDDEAVAHAERLLEEALKHVRGTKK